jgi:EmrB/QacA subfamily drug resistance transporter
MNGPGATDDVWSGTGLDRVRARRVLALVSVGFFITALDFTIVNVAFRSIRDEFGHDSARLLPWTLSGYAIAFAAGLLTAGRMADAFGRKRAFLIGNVVFAAASMICGFAPTVGVIVLGRVLQAIGGAMLVPTATALVLPEYPVSERAHVFGMTSAMGSIAAAMGPVVGGVLTSQLGWRWVFFVNLPIGVVVVVAGQRVLRESRDPLAATRPDLLGASLAIGSVGLLTLAIVQAEEWGWHSAAEVVVVVAAIALGVAFVARCRVSADPVLDLTLLRARFVWSANAANLLWSMGFYAMYFSNVGWLQDVWGYSPQRSGLAYLPGPVVATLASILLTGRLRRFGPIGVVAAGASAIAVTSLAFTIASGESHRYVSLFLPMVMVIGLAIGSVLPVLSGAANAYLPANRFAMGSALYTTGRQIGAALGVAIVSALQTASPGVAGFHQSLRYVFAVMALTAVVMVVAYQRPTEADLLASGTR